MSSLADLPVIDLDEEFETENIPPQSVSPKNQIPAFIEASQLPEIHENIESISQSCIGLLNDLNLPPSQKNSGVYRVCKNILLIQHSAAVEYSKESPDGSVSYDGFRDSMLDVVKSQHGEPIVKSFSNYVNILDALEGRNDRVIGGNFHDRVSVLASMISFIVRSSHQASVWENTDQFWIFADETYKKYRQYEESISRLNVTEAEKNGVSEWLATHFPRSIMSAWVSSFKHGPRPSL